MVRSVCSYRALSADFIERIAIATVLVQKSSHDLISHIMVGLANLGICIQMHPTEIVESLRTP